MAQGKLVIASDVGGHRELIRDGETGFRFSAGEPAALAACLRRVLERREWWPALRAAARQFVEEERNWAVSVARYAEIYEKLVGTWKEKTQAGRRSVA
jgi:glycosyltransferase involved in cell wall biosynthesis